MAEPTFEQELEHLINKHCMENGSDTPDFILAQFLSGVLHVWNAAVMRREDWYTDAETLDVEEQAVQDALNAGAGLPPPVLPDLPYERGQIDALHAEVEQARKEFRAGCRQILWRSLENVDAFAESIGDVSVGEALSGWVEDLIAMISENVEADTPSNESKPS